MSHPQKIETVHLEHLNNELCIYDWQRMEVHNLNPTAAQVWQLCDGQTTPQKMAAQLQGDLTPAQAEELVWLTLARLEKAHLLQGKGVQPAGPQREVITRRELLKGLGVAAALLPVVSSIVAPGPVEAQSPQPPGPPAPGCSAPLGQSQTFSFTGAEQQFIVPAGVTCVTIQAFGAQGGINTTCGEGGTIQATIPVTPGETLFVYVGGQGGDGILVPPFGGGPGGFNGGGTGGAAATTTGGGGGGASDVRQGGNGLNNRVVVAGGGGGGDGYGDCGGFGGYQDGFDGAGGGAQAGQGGTQTSGGAGGTGVDGGANGTAGSLGTGGVGGAGTLGAGGGGGGGGYYGGGGSGGDGDALNNIDSSAGGGGSGFVIPTATNISFPPGLFPLRDGRVIISW